MKYARIAALVPATEHFDETAIVNEGGWISTQHLGNIETAIDTLNETVVLKANAITAANLTIATRDEEVVALLGSFSAQGATVTTQAARIVALEAEVAKLSKAPSGPGSKLTTPGDPVVEETKTASYLDDNNPANAWIDARMKKK